MILTNEIRNQLLSIFPKIELSYEKILHKKVPADMFMLIPKGNKVFVWIMVYQGKKICLVVSFMHNESKIYSYSCEFSDECAKGTIMYGTLFDYKGVKHFTCEDIFYYKGKPVSFFHDALNQKISIFKDIFINNHIIIPEDKVKNNRVLIIGLPVMLFSTTIEDAFTLQAKLPYMVYSIQVHSIQQMHRHHKIGTYLIKNGVPAPNVIVQSALVSPPLCAPCVPVSAPLCAPSVSAPSMPIKLPVYLSKKEEGYNTNAIIKVKATPQDDIYHLFCIDSPSSYNMHEPLIKKEKYIGIAMISTYKSSVMMNSIFRKIKENENLDLLEESDDEDFENMDINKYVDLEKSVLMNCVYLKRFKKWQPLSIFHGKESSLFSYNEIKKREY